MLKILQELLGFLSGNVATALADAYKAKETALTDTAKIAADERIAQLQQIADLQKAEAGSRVNAVIRGSIAIGPAIYLGKIFLWDKVLGLGATDPLSADLWAVTRTVLAFYFLHDTALGVTRIVARRKS